MKVSIVVPVFGAEMLLTACLESIALHTPRELYELLLIDNATGHHMQADCVVRNETNRGFGYASNQGAGLAVGDVICFLNVDTEVQPNWLPPMMAAFDDPEVAMVGPKIVHPAGDIQTTGIRTWHGNGSAGGEELKDDSPSRDVDGVTGACMLIRRDVFNRLGGFCELYRQGYEDVDLCLTMREAGYRARFVAESVIVHHESATGPERWQYTHDNVRIMDERWCNR